MARNHVTGLGHVRAPVPALLTQDSTLFACADFIVLIAPNRICSEYRADTVSIRNGITCGCHEILRYKISPAHLSMQTAGKFNRIFPVAELRKNQICVFL